MDEATNLSHPLTSAFLCFRAGSVRRDDATDRASLNSYPGIVALIDFDCYVVRILRSVDDGSIDPARGYDAVILLKAAQHQLHFCRLAILRTNNHDVKQHANHDPRQEGEKCRTAPERILILCKQDAE